MIMIWCTALPNGAAIYRICHILGATRMLVRIIMALIVHTISQMSHGRIPSGGVTRGDSHILWHH